VITQRAGTRRKEHKHYVWNGLCGRLRLSSESSRFF
jgi:hypothetical protein